ncbi:hypothetical protein [Streptomyces similanensis]|uniref:Uncharacterized protein n=1 Tax=Streptomyces similanensis TaxID=1274988 RepID=A0ABP9L4N8_9ACTN
MTPEILARITAARAARDLSDLARQTVAATAEPASPAERIQQARLLRKMAADVVDLVVLAERLAGASWEEITQALRRRDEATVREEYDESVAEWAALPEDRMEAAAAGAEALDAWYSRHREDHDPESSSPVTDLLNRH